MNKWRLTRILGCVALFSVALFAYLDARNDVTKLMIELPKISGQLIAIEELNTILQYEVEKFENPAVFLALLKETKYAHLLSNREEQVIALSNKEDKVIEKDTLLKGFRTKALLGTGVR